MLGSVLACPRCDRAPLDPTDAGHRCGGCATDFPSIDGIPWLFAEPGSSLAEWRSRVEYALETLAEEHRRLAGAAKSQGIGELTRRRLTIVADANRDHAARLAELLSPLGLESPGASYTTHLAFRTRLPADQSLTTYAYNVHRDWSWGHEENEASFAIVREALDGAPPGRTLVVGAGAGRLAYDFHMRTASDATIVLDFNPFLLLLAQRITSGGAVELYEFPLAPRSIEQHAVLRKLAAEAPCRDGLHYVLADALHPPFVAGAFDTIVTPWLVDILPERFENLCARLNGLLREGGRWINFGTLSFHVGDPALRYSVEECTEIIAASGFDVPVMRETPMPYLCSPASRHGRRERILSWTTVKRRTVPRPPRYEALPDWIVRGEDPVPLLEPFRQQAESTRVRAFTLSLIDGRRSLRDMAQVFVDQKLLTFEQAEAAIRAALIRLYEASRRP